MAEFPLIPLSPLVPLQQPTLSESLSGFGRGPSTRPAIGRTEEKQAQVTATTEEKARALGGREYTDQDLRLFATAYREGHPLADDPMIQDMARYGEDYIALKYGPEVVPLQRRLSQALIDARNADHASRSPDEQLGDTLRSFGSGAVGALGGMGAMAAGTLNERAGAAVSRGVNQVTDKIHEGDSPAIQDQREQGAYRAELDRRDNAEEYKKDVEAGVSFPGLRRFGREFLDKAEDFYEHPSLAADVTAEGIGSFAGALGLNSIVAKGAAKFILKSRGIPGERAARFLNSARGREFVRGIATRGMPASIGAQEAGGAYIGIQAEIQAMSEEELMEGSPEYRDLRKQSFTHEAARDRIASAAALEGGAIQGLIGAATGKLVSRFEAAPFAAGRGRALLNTGKEALEEGIQGTSGEVVAGHAIQRRADESRDPLEGAGTAAAEGVVAGAGMAGVIQAPQLAAKGAAAGASATAQAAAKGFRARLRAVEQAKDDDSTVGTRAITEAAARIEENVARLNEATTANPDTSAESTAPAEPATKPLGQRLNEEVVWTTGAEINAAPAPVRQALGANEVLPEDEQFERLKLLTGLAEKAKKGAIPEEDAPAVALWLHDQASNISALRNEDIAALGENAVAAFEQILADIDTILENPELAKLAERAQSVTSADLGPLPEVTDENVESPEVQQAVNQTVALAHANPAGVDPKFINKVLNQRKAGRLPGLSDRVVSRLRNAARHAREAADADRLKAGIDGLKKTTDIVRSEVASEGKDGNQDTQPGLTEHLTRIEDALDAGQVEEAQEQLDALRNFGEHYHNKVRAALESARMRRRGNNTVYFRRWTGTTWLEADHPSAGQVFISPFSKASLATGREAVVDARAVTNLYNNLLKAYGGQLKGEALPPVRVPKKSLLRPQSKGVMPASQARDETPAETPQTQSEAKPSAETQDQDAAPAKAQPAAGEVPGPEAPETAQAEEKKTEVNNPETVVKSSDGTTEAQTQEASRGDQQGEAEADPQARTASEEPAAGAEGREAAGDEDAAQPAEPAPVEGAEPDGDARGDDGNVAELDPGVDADGGVEAETATPAPDFSNLAPSKDGTRRFTRAYKIDPAKAPLMVEGNPARAAIEALKKPEELSVGYHVPATKARQLAGFVEAEAGRIVKAMNTRLTEKAKTLAVGTKRDGNRRELTPLEAVAPDAPKDYLSFKEARALNIVDPAAGEYDPRLLQSAALAALHWVMSSPKDESLDVEDVAKFFGVSESDVTLGMMQATQWGIRGVTAKESLARTILAFWGAEIQPDAPMSDSLGIAQAVAAELLEVMDGHLVTTQRFEIKGFDDQGREITKAPLSVRLSHPETAEQVQNIGGMKRLLADAFLPQAEKPHYFDETPPKVRRTQKGNPQGKLGPRILRALRKHQEIPFFRNTPYVQLMQAMGQEAYARLMGARDIDPELTNKVDALSIEGKNTQLLNAWQGVADHNEQLEAHAEANEKNPDEVATHFDWYAVANERIHADGFNPQADKSMREAFTATVSTLDLTTEEGRDQFWHTIAQSIGVKTEKGTRTSNIKKAQELVGAHYQNSVAALESWLETGEISPEQIETLQAEMADEGASPKLLHALLAVARFEQAIAEGGEAESSFRHNLALEADGKTDGPINAMVHFISGKFSWEQIRNMAKGGFFVGSGRKTLNEHGQADGADLYETAAKLMEEKLGNLLNNVRQDPVAHQQARDITRLMNQLLGDKDFRVDWAKGEIEIGRKTLKNPLTITIYGSGKRGIAGKVANGLMEMIYARMTEAAADNQPAFNAETMALIEAVTTKRVFYHQDSKKWLPVKTVGRDKLKRPAPLGNLRDARNFEFSPANRQMLLENVLTFFVGPMSSAIEEMMGGTQATLKGFQAATQVQSALMVERFRQTVQDRLKEKRDPETGELGPGEFLTQDDYNAIFSELARYGAVIENVESDAHHLNLSNRKSAPSRESFARSLSGRFGGETSLGEPSDAGVSASPMLTISRGDAAMMVNFFASQEMSDAERLRTLPVFDGLEMPADGIETISEQINKAVADAWLENPAQAVADSFADWLRQGEKGPLDGIQDPETFAKLARALGLDAEKIDGKAAEETIIALRDQLQETARSIQARKNVYSRIGFSVDHMASGESPYVQDGETFEGDLVEHLNQLYEEELAKLEAAAESASQRPAIEAPSEELQARVEQVGTKLWDGMYQVSSQDVVRLLSGAGVDTQTQGIARALAKVLPDFQFFFGSSGALTRLRNEVTPELQEAGPIESGQIDPLGGAVYIANTAGETVLHEMLHAATIRLVHQFYSDPDSLDTVPRDALENLERLMGQFTEMDFSNENASTARAAKLLAGEIRDALTMGSGMGQAKALSEFIAWTLSNQNLAETLKKSRVRTPLKKLAFRALGFIRRLFGLKPDQHMDMFSNIAMNVNAVLAANRLNQPVDLPGGLVLNQVSGKTSDPRLERLMRDFDAKIAAHLRVRRNLGETTRKATEDVEIYAIADEALNLIQAGGFQLDPQQQSAFRSIQAALASSMQLDGKALIRVQKLFTHVLGQIDLANFNELMDKYGSLKDPQGRSTLMASFLALSQVDPEFRKILAETRLPKNREIKWNSIDNALTSMTEGLMNSLATTISGEGHGNKSALQSLDRLADVLAQIEQDDRTYVEKEANRILGRADDAGAKFLSRVGERLVSFTDGATLDANASLSENTRTLLKKSAGIIGGLLDKEKGQSVAMGLTSAGNNLLGKPWIPLLEFMNEVFGITDENRAVYDLVNRVKHAISRMRQDHRTDLPKLLAGQFSRQLSRNEWSQLHLGLGKTDIAALGERFSPEEIRKLLSDPKALTDEISKIEETLRGKARPLSREYLRKAEELAEFMVSGRVTTDNLLSNAEAIARLLNEKGEKRAQPDETTIQAIDELTTLYALQKLDQGTWTTLTSLAQNEARGMDFLTYHLANLRRLERAKHSSNEIARLNGWKGHIPAEIRDGASLIVANDREHNKLVSLGYTRLGDYKGSGMERGRRGYYYSAVSGRNTYHQGVMQTVQTTSFGVDPRTGHTVSGITAGRVPGRIVGEIQRRLAAQSAQGAASGRRSGGEPLLPVFGAKGKVVAYERSLAPERLAALNRNTHLGEMIGAWAGRQAEEELAQGFNRMLVDKVWEIWEKGKRDGRTNEFVDLSDPDLDDPVQAEAWKLVPQEMRDYIREKFGDNGFMVRRDMVNNAVGYRAASVGDAWTSASRWDEKTRKAFTDTATAVLGKNAFPWLTRAEKFWQAGVSMAKHTIVIRSIVVPVSNLASNFFQLTAHGVGPRDIAKGFTTKLVEIDQYLKNRDRIVEIGAFEARYHKEPAQLRKLAAEKKLLEDANRRLSIWPLIEAGEFSTIAEGQTEADAAIMEGKWVDWMQNQLERVPTKLGDLGRYALITRDTALFKGMARATQYGDFLAKAVLYDHVTKRKGAGKDAALKLISEEFVNYNLLPGRTRSYAESMGLTWFWAYKIKSLKVAHRLVRDHPLRALMSTAGAGMLLPNLPQFSIGSPITDNLVGKAIDGGLNYSIGPEMLFSAPGLHPWVNIAH